MAHRLNLDRLNTEFETKRPEEIIRWAISEFYPRFAMTSSFGPESGTLLHMASRIEPSIPVLFLDTGYHFKETLEYKQHLTELLGLKNVIDLKADPGQLENVAGEPGYRPVLEGLKRRLEKGLRASRDPRFP